jgi:hypothetical protein
MTPFLVKLELGVILGCSVEYLGQQHVVEDLWPRICNAGGMWLNGDFVDLERCVWTSGSGEIGQALVALSELGCPTGRVVVIDSMLEQCMDAAHEWQQKLDGESRKAFLTAMQKCCIEGCIAGCCCDCRTCPALPRATDLAMMLDVTLPMLLKRELAEADLTWEPAASMPENGLKHNWSQPIKLCYQAVITTLKRSAPHGQRWQIPVLTANLQICHLNRQLAREEEEEEEGATALVVLPDRGNCPKATFLVLRHFGEHCLHPALVSSFIRVANMQDFGLESPRARVQRTFRNSLRLAVADAAAQTASVHPSPYTLFCREMRPTILNEKPGMAVDEVNKALGAEWSKLADAQRAKYNKTADSSGAGTAVDDSDDGLDQVWALVSEVYERPMVLEASIENEETAIPPRLQDADHWELLMWAAITCAKQWIRMQATSNPTLNPRHGSRF